MKTSELRNLTEEELVEQLRKLEGELVSLKHGIRQGTDGNHARLSQLRRDIARVKTLRREKVT